MVINMRIIGITGGVGSGKTQLLDYIRQHYNCEVVLADEVANRLKEPGEKCYEAIVKLLGNGILHGDATIDRQKMAEMIFRDKDLLDRVNEVIHPAVREYITELIAKKRQEKKDFFFIEAALLIEAGYEDTVDEFWYVYASLEERKRRLKAQRGYTQEKTDSIAKEQLSEETFRRTCRVIIDNSGVLEDAYRQIDKKLGEYLWQN